mgnify:CR=1 FL=1
MFTSLNPNILLALSATGYELTSVNSAGGMTLMVGINPGFKNADKAVIEVRNELTEEIHRVETSKQAALACIKLFLEGDEGNEDLYPLAEPLQPANLDLRFIP